MLNIERMIWDALFMMFIEPINEILKTIAWMFSEEDTKMLGDENPI